MPKGDYPGEFEVVVLLAVARLGDDAYGMTIRREIQETTGRDVSVPAVYVTLDRLEKKGYLASEMGEPTGERGGRAKRFYSLRPEGVEALETSRRMLGALWKGVDLARFRP